MWIKRKFTTDGQDPFSTISYERYDCKMVDHRTGVTTLEIRDCEVPATWSKNSRDILISKYFRKAGVPSATIPYDATVNDPIPHWLRRFVATPNATFGGERSVKQVVNRLAGHWTYEGFKNGYFQPTKDQITNYKASLPNEMTTTSSAADVLEKAIVDKLCADNAKAYYDEMVYMLLNQMGAPNSPQWFNTGLYWAYGITGTSQGHYYVAQPQKITVEWNGDADDVRKLLLNSVVQSTSAYEKVQAHACFILGVEDSMTQEDGILDWYAHEALIFKYGSGAGANVSKLRGKNERLSGGGKSSGVMSWVEVADRSAGAIKSGGTTRRAAKMVRLDLDHPDILEFIHCKVESEVAVASMVTGNKLINDHCHSIITCVSAHGSRSVMEAMASGVVNELILKAQTAGVSDNYIHKAIQLAIQGETVWPTHVLNNDFDSRAYHISSYQNANHSVGIPSSFYEAVDKGSEWVLINRTDKKVASTMSARDLEMHIAEAAWFCGDPGVQFDTIINDWNVTASDGRINASNPCSEHLQLDNTACNLASINLMKFVRPLGFDIAGYRHAISLFQLTLDITNAMSHLPDKKTAVNTFLYRNTGLGYGNLGAVIMAYGLPYDSAEARALTGALTAILHGQAHITSATMAQELGAYPRFIANKEHHMRCVRNHRAAALDDGTEFESLTISPACINYADLLNALGGSEFISMKEEIHAVWSNAYELGCRHGYRNAEMTVLAPTGTIGFLMDFDTTGVEPVFALKTSKQLVGGGTMSMTTTSAVLALTKLGYSDNDTRTIMQFIVDHGYLPTNKEADGNVVVKESDLPVFATALTGSADVPAISWIAHIKMMAAAQSFISGGISKTVNMPGDATIEDVREAYRMAHDHGTKCVALYRDGSKLSQPLTIHARPRVDVVIKADTTAVTEGLKAVSMAIATGKAETILGTPTDIRQVILANGGTVSPAQIADRTRLGWCRKPGIDIAVEIDLGRLYLRTTRYDDGKIAEIWATYSADQGIVQALLDTLCKTANLALQYGVPLRGIIDSWIGSKFDPCGLIGSHPFIKVCTSLPNLMARLLEYHELGETDHLNVQPDAHLSEEDDAALQDDIASSPESFAGVSLTGERCPDCASQRYVHSGSGCKKCLDCGRSGGCG